MTAAASPFFDFETEWNKAEQLYENGKRADARATLERIVATHVDADNAEGIRAKEQAIGRLGEVYAQEKQTAQLIALLQSIRAFFEVLPKAKTTNIVRRIFDNIFAAGATIDERLAVCKDTIAWAREEKRTFLRHRIELRLAEVHFEKHEALEALAVINALLKEIRRLDDRLLLVDAHLLESKVYYSIKNFSKSRAALVSARTNANSIYCPPLAQAEIDMQSGLLHAEERDFKTAFSYLFEAFEGFHSLGDRARQARAALRYMILSKISTENPDELRAVLTSKSVLEYKGRDIDALRQIAQAYQKEDTRLYTTVLRDFSDVLDDPIVRRHLDDMYDALLEKHILKTILPYNRVQIAHIADLLGLQPDLIEARCSQMILDKKLNGIVDQQHNCLVVFEEAETESKGAQTSLYKDSLDTLEAMDRVVTALFDKVAGKFDHLVEENIKKRKEDEAKKKEERAKRLKENASGDNKADEKKAAEEKKGDEKK